MALLWMDGFDTYGGHGADAGSVLASSGYVSALNIETNNATRTGRGMCLRLAWGAVGWQVGEVVRAFETVDEVVAGFAINCNVSNLTELCFLQYDNRFGTVRNQAALYLNAQGGVTFARGSADGTVFVAASSPNIMFAGVWHYVEVKYKPGSHMVVRVDGVTVLSVGGDYNEAQNPQLVNRIRFYNGGGNLNDFYKYIDDLYVCDTSGAAFNDFCGDVVVHAVMPSADAGPNDWQAFGGGLANYTTVDDIPPDGDVSYLYSNTVGHTDMFDVDQLPANIIDVLAVSVHARIKKDAAGASMVQLKCRYQNDTATSPSLPMTTQYSNKHQIFEQAPDGGSWNRVKANNMQIGVEIV